MFEEQGNMKRLVDMEVLASQTGEKLGRLTDILINPEEGKIFGIVVESDTSRPGNWLVRDYNLNGEALVVLKDELFPLHESSKVPQAVSVVNEIMGARVVTTHGLLLGRVSEAGFSSEGSLATFRISKSVIDIIFRRGPFIKSNVPNSYLKDGSEHGARLIVPSEMTIDEPKSRNSFGWEMVAGFSAQFKRQGLFIALVAILFSVGIIATLLVF